MNEDIFHLSAKALITNAEGRFLVLRQNPTKRSGLNPLDYWDLPGGRLNRGDNLKKTLTREVAEEIGIEKIKIHSLFDTSIANVRVKSGQNIVGLILFTYICTIDKDSEIKLMDDEHIEYKWCSKDEAISLLKVKFSKTFIKKLSKL